MGDWTSPTHPDTHNLLVIVPAVVILVSVADALGIRLLCLTSLTDRPAVLKILLLLLQFVEVTAGEGDTLVVQRRHLLVSVADALEIRLLTSQTDRPAVLEILLLHLPRVTVGADVVAVEAGVTSPGVASGEMCVVAPELIQQ